MTKNTVKLTESQLNKVIAESVQRVLSELDYKTYQNAARKAGQIGDTRWKKFQDKSRDEFNNKYGYQKGDYDNGEGVYLGNNGVKGYENKTVNKNNYDITTQKAAYRQGGQGGQTAYTTKNYSDTYGGSTDMHNDGSNTNAYANHFNPYLAQKYLNADAEYQNYQNGNYVYDKERGWHLKESKLNAIIAESIKKVLGK